MSDTQSSQSNNPSRSGLGIFAKSLIIITAAMVVIVGAALTVMVQANNSKETQNLADRGKLVASLQAAALVRPLWDFEMESAQALVEALGTDPAFQAAWVTDTKGKLVTKAGEPLEAGDFSNFTADIVHTEDGKSEPIGSLTLQLNHNLLKKSSQNQLTVGLISSILLLAAILAAVTFILRMIITPMRDMTESMNQLASGDHSVHIPAQERTDEVGQMAAAVQIFKENAIHIEEMNQERERNRQLREEKKVKETQEMADRFRTQVGQSINLVSDAAHSMKETSENMAGLINDADAKAGMVMSAAEAASGNVEAVAAAATELSSSIEEISGQAASSSRIAAEAVEQAGRASAQVEGLAEAAEKIGQVVSLINDIAEQTNLLALNATIEAARAGDAGKGFAVVASEVKNLASQTAKATDEIGSQISSVQGETRGAVEAIRSIEKTIADISEVSTAIASAVEEQGAATREIAANVDRASNDTNDVSSNISGVTASVGQTGSAANEVLTAANQLAEQSSSVQAAVNDFLSHITKTQN